MVPLLYSLIKNKVSRLTVVSRETKEEAASITLMDLRLTHEYYTGTRVVKIKNAITKKP